MQRRIHAQKLRVEEIRSSAYSIGGASDGMPRNSEGGSRTERSIEVLDKEEKKLANLRKRLDAYIDSIPDEYVRVLINMHLRMNKSWRFIAFKKGSTEDAVKKTVYRYRWQYLDSGKTINSD